MNKSRKTGNVLFDIFWEAYPPRVNGAGVMEKKKKGAALKYFEKHKPTEEAVFDMIEWLKLDKENRDKSDASGKFYSPPADAIVFLNQKRWVYDEIGTVATKSQRYETRRTTSVQNKNTKDRIAMYRGIVKEWPVARLKADSGFMHASRTYPDFAAWALEQRPELKENK